MANQARSNFEWAATTSHIIYPPVNSRNHTRPTSCLVSSNRPRFFHPSGHIYCPEDVQLAPQFTVTRKLYQSLQAELSDNIRWKTLKYFHRKIWSKCTNISKKSCIYWIAYTYMLQLHTFDTLMMVQRSRMTSPLWFVRSVGKNATALILRTKKNLQENPNWGQFRYGGSPNRPPKQGKLQKNGRPRLKQNKPPQYLMWFLAKETTWKTWCTVHWKY